MQEYEKAAATVEILTPRGTTGGRLYFLPADLGLYQRIDETRSAFLKILSVLPDASINPGGTGADPDSVEIINNAEQEFMRLLDYVCGTDTSTAAFKNFRPFAIMAGGSFWASSVLTALDHALAVVTKNTQHPKGKIKEGRFKWKKRK